jgi:flavodoxin
MKIGIVYYSRTGNTKSVANRLKENFTEMKKDVEMIEILHEKKPGFLKAGRAGIKQIELPIKNTDFNISKFDMILVGMPVWGFNPCPFFRSYFNNIEKLDGKKFGVFLTGGGEIHKNVEKGDMIREYLKDKGANIIGKTLTLQMQKGAKIAGGEENINEFVTTILK